MLCWLAVVIPVIPIIPMSLYFTHIPAAMVWRTKPCLIVINANDYAFVITIFFHTLEGAAYNKSSVSDGLIISPFIFVVMVVATIWA